MAVKEIEKTIRRLMEGEPDDIDWGNEPPEPDRDYDEPEEVQLARLWMTDDEIRDLIALDNEEPDRIFSAGITYASPAEFIQTFQGVYLGDMEMYGLEVGADPVDNVVTYLEKNWYGGETLGMIIVSFPDWSPEDQAKIRPALTVALHRAATEGVDH